MEQSGTQETSRRLMSKNESKQDLCKTGKFQEVLKNSLLQGPKLKAQGSPEPDRQATENALFKGAPPSPHRESCASKNVQR